MRILYLTLNFPDKEFGDSIYTDLANYIHASGHRIDVFTISKKKVSYISNNRGFTTYFLKTIEYFSNNLFKKAFSLLLMPFIFKHALKKYINDHKYDLILCDAPPFSLISVSKWASIKFNAPLFLAQKDFFPENAADLGIINKKGVLYRVLERKEKKLLNKCDYIGTMSPANSAFVVEKHKVSKHKVCEFPNTISPVEYYQNNDLSDDFKEEHIVGAIGNMGKPQYVDLIIRIACYFKEDKKVKFVIAGRGSELSFIEKNIEKHELKNIVLYKSPNRALSDFLTKKCTIGLITLDPRFTIPNFPSRVLSYMKQSKPVLAATDLNTDFGFFVENVYKCGVWANSNDFNSVIKKLQFLLENDDLSKSMGECGKTYFLNHLIPSRNVETLEKIVVEKDQFVFKKITNPITCNEIATVHFKCFPNHFLTSIGKKFLRSFYKLYIKKQDSGVVGCFLDDSLIGFLSFTNHNSRLAKKTILSHPISIGFPTFLKLVFNKLFRTRFFAALHGTQKINDGIYFSSLAVLEQFRNQHIGRELIKFAENHLHGEYGFAYVLTDFYKNEAVINFYNKCGYNQNQTFLRKDGRLMVLLLKELEK